MTDIRIEDHTDEVIEKTRQAIENALETVGLLCEGDAKLELEADPRRIDTGNLRNSITHRVDMQEQAVYIGTNVDYAIYVHEGTRRMEPNRFLKNAVEHNMGDYQMIFDEYLSEVSEK